MKRIVFVSAMVIMGMVLMGGFARSAPGPELMNYQGVLRDNTGAPVTTDPSGVDVVFRFFDSLTAGNEVLVDSHLAAGTGGVVVTDGLFNVSIGSGTVSAGSGTGAVSTLGDLFRSFSTVYLEVEIESETLNPRTSIHSAPYAMNVLDETDVDVFVSNNGYALQAGLASVATSGDFTDLTGVPFGLSDGDDDALNDLACAPGQVPRWSGSSWECADVTPVTTPNLVGGTELAFPMRKKVDVPLVVPPGPFEFVVGTIRAWSSLGGEVVTPMMSANNLNYAPAYVEADQSSGRVKAVGWSNTVAINNLGDLNNLALRGGNISYRAFDRIADYDSNWFACDANQTYTNSHPLGVFPSFALVEVAENSDGSGWRVPTMSSTNHDGSNWRQTAIVKLDANSYTLRTHGTLFITVINGFGTTVAPSSAYCRVRLFDWAPDYDSGWVFIHSANSEDRNRWVRHGLGVIPSLEMLYVGENIGGTGWVLPAMGSFHSDYCQGVGMYNTTKEWATVKGGACSVAQFVDESGAAVTATTGLFRYMAWR